MNDETLGPRKTGQKFRYYFDYNATRPMLPEVLAFLQDAPWGNPSSLHSFGRAALQTVQESAAFILDFLGLAKTHRVIFHSGATEGLISLILGRLHYRHSLGQEGILILGGGDHRAIYDLKKNPFLGLSPARVVALALGAAGEFKAELAQEVLTQQLRPNSAAVLTYTLVNSETGVVWDPAAAAALKEKWGDQVTVVADATQLPGKVAPAPLAPEVDAYVFSGHKMGALPGTGFSCVRQDLKWDVFLTGAGQQAGWRGGTENVSGIASLKIALQAWAKIDFSAALAARQFLENALAQSYPAARGPWRLIAPNAPRAVNTISFLDHDPNFLLAFWDQKGIAASLGPACSAALAAPSPTLRSMGMDAQTATQLVRLSFPPLGLDLANEYAQVLANAWPSV